MCVFPNPAPVSFPRAYETLLHCFTVLSSGLVALILNLILPAEEAMESNIVVHEDGNEVDPEAQISDRAHDDPESIDEKDRDVKKAPIEPVH